jgi:Fibronectin type III domain
MARISTKFLAVVCSTGILSGCAQIGAPVPPSLELPKQVDDLRVTRKGSLVRMSWAPPTKITDGQTIQHLGPTRICRSMNVPMTQCDTVVAEKISAKEFTDRLIAFDSRSVASYAVEVMNSDGRSAGLSNQVTIPLFPTLPPPQALAAQVVPQGVSLTWQWLASSDASLEFRLRIYRRSENGKSEVKVGEISQNDEANFLDQSFEWEHTYFYRTTFVSVSGDQQVEGEDSSEVKVFAHDVFPPAVPLGLQAVFSSVGQPNFIDLTWTPNTDAELAGYNVYRQEERGQLLKINSELAKIPTYRDRDIRPGKKYFYSVTAVDLRGNESGHSEESGESVP